MNKKMIKELLKAHCTIENGRWVFKQVDIDAATLELEQAISAKPIVSRSVEFEKPQPTLSADEIKTTAEMLWKKPMKLESVKLVMKLGYSIKDAKAYCDLHFG
jgi:hypothetical protein